MAITTTENKIIYTCDSTVTDYAFPYPVLKDTDLQVYLYDSAGNKTQLTLGTDYTVAITDTGATVTLTTAYDSTHQLLIYREVPETQETRYYEGGPFPAEEHEKALDKLTMIVQQLSEKIARAILKELVTDKLDLHGAVLKNVGNAVDPTDGVNLSDVLAHALPLVGTYYDAGGKAIKNLPNPADGQDACNYQTVINNISGSVGLHALTEKTTPVDNDELLLADSEDLYNNKKTTVFSILENLPVLSLTEKTTLLNEDIIVVADSSNNYTISSVKFSNIQNFDYVDSTNPSVSVNPQKKYALWLNSTTGEIFVCIDNTVNANVWKEIALVDLSNVQDNVILNKLLNVDGSGSLLDADKVDGYETSTTPTANVIPIADANGTLDDWVSSPFVAGTNYIKFSNGLKIQFGNTYVASGSSLNISFPVAFSGTSYSVSFSSSAQGSVNYINITYKSLLYFTINNGSSLNTTISWIAIGY